MIAPVNAETARGIAEANLRTYQRLAGQDLGEGADELIRRMVSDIFAGDLVKSIVTPNLGAIGARDVASERESEIE